MGPHEEYRNDFTKEEWESRDLTTQGFFFALADIIEMGMYLLGAFGAVVIAFFLPYVAWFCCFVALGLLFTMEWAFLFWRLVQPRDHYPIVIRIVYPNIDDPENPVTVETTIH